MVAFAKISPTNVHSKIALRVNDYRQKASNKKGRAIETLTRIPKKVKL